jgi:organic radical activating enzyme
MEAEEKNLKAVKDQIYNLIRSGMKTSEISAQFRYPLEIIKEVKSNFLEEEKKRDRDSQREAQLKHMANKREIHHQRFLDRIGQTTEGVQENLPVEVVAPTEEAQAEQSQDATVQAPALGADFSAT